MGRGHTDRMRPDEVLLVYSRRVDGDEPLLAAVARTEDAVALHDWLGGSPKVEDVCWEEHPVVGVAGAVGDGMEVHVVSSGGPSNDRPWAGAGDDPTGLSVFAHRAEAERYAEDPANAAAAVEPPGPPVATQSHNRVRTVRVGTVLLDR